MGAMVRAGRTVLGPLVVVALLSSVAALVWSIPPASADAGPISLPQVDAGPAHTCGIRTDGTIACWGANYDDRATPPAGTFVQVSAGGAHTCGLRTDGTVACWGFGGHGETTPPAGTFTQISADGGTSCGVRTDGTVACWGRDEYGQASPPAGTFTRVVTGGDHTCGLRTDGTLACWGLDASGKASPPPGTFVDVTNGAFHSCGVRSDGTVACWGDGSDGQTTPPPGTFTQVSAGYLHTCGLRTDGAAVCWGANGAGQSSPLPGTFTHISVGDNHGCGARPDGTIACWAGGSLGEAQPRITIAAPGAGDLEVEYSHTFTTTFMHSPAEYTVTGGALPPGLTLSGAGVLSGTPTAGGSFGPITVSAFNGLAPVATQTFTIAVSSPTAATETALTSSGSPSTYGQPLTFTAAVASDADTPTGAVSFTEGTNTLCAGVTLDPGGSATCSTSTLGAGSHDVTATYAPDTTAFAGSAASLVQVVDRAPLAITASSGSMTYGGAVPAITPSYAGFVDGEGPSVFTTAPVCSTTATSTSGVGSYPSACAGAAAANYAISYVGGTVAVGQAPLSITASGGSMTYGGAVPAISPSYAGFVAGDDASDLTTPAVCSTSASSSSPVGTYAASCGGAEAANYTIIYASGSVVVGTAVLTVVASSGSMPYGGAVPAISPSYVGFVAGDDASDLTTMPACSTAATAASGVGTYPSSCAGAVAANYAISYVGGTVAVTPAPLTLTASGGSMTYGGAVPAITPGYTGFVNGEGQSVLTTAPVCSTTATSTSSTGSYPSACGGAAAANYTITYVGGTVLVNPAALTVVASSGSMTYGGGVPAITPSYAGFVAGDDVSDLTTPASCFTAATSTSGVGAYPSSCSGASAANYSVVYVGGTVVVMAAPLTITASSGSMTYGGAVPAITPSYSGFVNDDDAADLATPPACSTSATSSSGVGSYPSSCAGAAAANYSVGYVGGTVVVMAAPLTITASSGSMTYGGAVPAITPSYSGFVNDDDAANLVTPPACSTTATSSSGVGAYASSCAGAVAANYSITYVGGTVVVAPAPLTISASGGSMTYGGAVLAVTPSYSGFVNGDDPADLAAPPTCSTMATSSSGAGSYPSSCAGAVAANYSIGYVGGTVVVDPAVLRVVADDASKVYGQPNPVLTFHLDGFVNGDGPGVVSGAPVLSITATPNSGVGSYPITVAPGTLAAANYRFVLLDGTLTVAPATLRVVADHQTRPYSQPNPPLTHRFEGFVLGDTAATAVTGAPVLSTTATPASHVGTYPITIGLGTLAAANYRFDLVGGTLTVTRAPTLLVASPQIVVLPLGLDVPDVTARLTAFGQPVPGRTVTFTTDGRLLCRGVTTANGIATCNPGLFGELAILLDGGYSATYAGELDYLPATDTVAVITIT